VANKFQKIKFFVLSEREYKVAESLDIHNLMSIEKFMEGKNKPFKRIVTGYLIHDLISQFPNTFQKKNVINLISKKLHKTLVELEDYSKKNYNSYCDRKIYTAMLEIAEQHKLFDETIYTEYRQVRTLLEKHPFIDITLQMMPHYYENNKEQYAPVLKVFTDLFKYHRERMDYTNYHQVVLNEDVPLQETLTDETVDQLQENN
jgi:hypothetical protein